jgi:hypothetical protein
MKDKSDRTQINQQVLPQIEAEVAVQYDNEKYLNECQQEIVLFENCQWCSTIS